MGIFIIFSGFFSWQLMTILLSVYAVLAVADLFKRHLLSNSVVYWITMLLAPFAALTSIAVPLNVLLVELNKEEMNWIKVILTFIGGLALLLFTAAVYIRGHIAPLNKASEKYGDNRKYFAAKRLIKVGCTGTLIYAVPFTVMSCVILGYMSVGAFVFADVIESNGLIGIVYLIVMIIAIFLIPIVNLVAICMLFFLGIEFMLWGITAAAVLLADILIANGCIRYILTTDRTKGQKALWIFLSFIPVFNFWYGIYCIVKINKSLKENSFSY